MLYSTCYFGIFSCIVNYPEFEVETYEDLYKEENTVYTCIVVLLHALLKCTNNKYRYQLSERMDNKEQVFLASFLEATQSSLFIKQHISKSLDVASNTQIRSPDISGKNMDIYVLNIFKFNKFIVTNINFKFCVENK